MSRRTFRGFAPRPKGFYPIIDGLLRPELLPPVAAHELTAADRNYREPFIGITTDGTPETGLYSLMDTGISGKRAIEAALGYLDTLRPHQRTVANHPMDSPEWRHWTNAFPNWAPNGLQLGRLEPAQRQAALALFEASLSAEGFAAVRSAMKLNAALGELIDDYHETLTEFAYWLTIFGEPGNETWGWQLMGHHIDLHCVFVGNQLVLAPVFLGAEFTEVADGPYAGVRTFDAETDHALELRRTMRPGQEEQFLLGTSLLAADLPPELAGPFNGRHLAGAGADNLVLPNEGIPGAALTSEQQDLLRTLIHTYVSRMPAEHAKHKLDQVERHFDRTYFAWRGGHGESSAFYYRIHSPVLLIEYDNHPGIFLDNDEPERFHVHTIVREPNGNDYGMNLLAQHYARHHR